MPVNVIIAETIMFRDLFIRFSVGEECEGQNWTQHVYCEKFTSNSESAILREYRCNAIIKLWWMVFQGDRISPDRRSGHGDINTQRGCAL